jgi:S-adenosylmethionine decarboxylase
MVFSYPSSLGSINRDCWYLYMLSRGGGGPKSLIETTLSTTKKQLTPDPDQTIEILMTELDPKVMALFNKVECADAKEATEVSIIACNDEENL